MTSRSYGEGRTEVVRFRVTPQEKASLTSAATTAGLSLSDYARTTALSAPKVSSPETVAFVTAAQPVLSNLENAIAEVTALLEGPKGES